MLGSKKDSWAYVRTAPGDSVDFLEIKRMNKERGVQEFYFLDEKQTDFLENGRLQGEMT